MAYINERGDVQVSQETNTNDFSFSRPKQQVKLGPQLPFEGPPDEPLEWKWDDVGGVWRPRKICRYEPHTLIEEVMLPKYQYIEANELLEEKSRFAKFEAVSFGDGSPCNNPEQWSTLSDWSPPGDTKFPALHLDVNKNYHNQSNLTYWGLVEMRPYIGYWMQMQRSRCQEEFHKYSRQHAGLHALPGGYDTVYDSNLRHPASSAVYSVIRTHKTVTPKQRKEEMIDNFHEMYGSLQMHLDFLMRLNQTAIVIEPTALAQSIKGRMEYREILYKACQMFAFLTFCLASPKRRHPGIYLFPAVLTCICAYQYSNIYAKNDPTSMYGSWLACHNVPKFLTSAFGIQRHLFRQERMYVIQREPSLVHRRPYLTKCCYFVSLLVGKAFYDRIKIGNLAFSRKWEILEPYVAPQKLYSYLHTSYNSPIGSVTRFEFSQPTSIISKICISCAFVGLGLCCAKFFVNKYISVFSERSRERKRLGECIVRGAKGERRYRRLGEVLYWVFRKKHPDDPMCQLDEYYLERYTRIEPESAQYFY